MICAVRAFGIKVRNHLADLGETTAGEETFHDCTRPASAPDLPEDEDGWVPGQVGRGQGDGPPTPLFCAIDRHGTPQTSYPLSPRSVTTIVAARLAAAADAELHRAAMNVLDRPGAPATWSSDDHARVVAERQAATDHLASFEADLDEADASPKPSCSASTPSSPMGRTEPGHEVINAVAQAALDEPDRVIYREDKTGVDYTQG